MKKSTKMIISCYALTVIFFLFGFLYIKLHQGGDGALFCFCAGLFAALVPALIYSYGKNYNPLWKISLVIFLIVVSFVFFLAFNPPHCPIPKIILCSSHLKQIGRAIKLYSIDNKDWFPNKDGAAGLEQLRYNGYLTDYKMYVCPSTTDEAGSDNQQLTEENVSYVYCGGQKEGENVGQPVAWDKSGNHTNYGGSVLFHDGHVEGMMNDRWDEFQKKWNKKK